MKNLKLLIRLISEELLNIALWSFVFKHASDRLTPELRSAVMIGLGAAIFVVNIFDILSEKRYAVGETDGMSSVPLMLRAFISSVIFTDAYLYISGFAPARIGLLAALGIATAVVHIFFSDLFSGVVNIRRRFIDGYLDALMNDDYYDDDDQS